jgi:hypothetical protein
MDQSPKSKERKSLEDMDANAAKDRDLVQAYYKRGRSHTPSRQNRKREKERSTSSNLYDFEPQIERHRRAKSVSRADDMKKSSSRGSSSVKRFSKARQRKGEEDAKSTRSGNLPPLHIAKQRQV